MAELVQAQANHPLRREIVVNAVANSLINRGGITFAQRAVEETGASLAEVAKAYVIAREVFDLAGFASQVEAVDGVVAARMQSELYLEFRRLLDQAVRTLLRRDEGLGLIAAEIERYRGTATILRNELDAVMAGAELDRYLAQSRAYQAAGVPEPLARVAAGLVDLVATINIVELADALGVAPRRVAEAWSRIGGQVHLDLLLKMVANLDHELRWDASARSALRQDLRALVRAITADVLRGSAADQPLDDLVDQWAARRRNRLAAIGHAVSELEAMPQIGFAPLWVVIQKVRELVEAPAANGLSKGNSTTEDEVDHHG